MILINTAIFITSLVLLIKSSDYFVKAASALAKRLGVSEFIIGLTFVAVGTSLPELASSLSASFLDQDEIIIGNVIGSNIANIGIVLGIAASIAVIKTRKETVKMDGYLMFFSVLLLALFAADRVISVIEALAFLLFYGSYLVYLFDKGRELKKEYHFKEYLWYILRFRTITGAKKIIAGFFNGFNGKKASWKPILKDMVLLAVTGIGIIVGAHFTIVKAVLFAELLEVSKEAIGLVLIAVGTSLPELSVSITAARLGKGQIAIGNIVGSNIANILLILGVSALLNPIALSTQIIYFVMPVLLFMSALLLGIMKYRREINRKTGIVLVGAYLIFLFFLIKFIY